MQQGLNHLKRECTSKGLKFTDKTSIIPIYSFINQLLSSLRSYLRKPQFQNWADFIMHEKRIFNSLVILTNSWIQHSKTSLECQLLSRFLMIGDRMHLKLFLRLRRYICQYQNVEMLDEITLKHEDVIIALVHRMFTSQEFRKKIINGLKSIFISFKISEARIYSCVFIQYVFAIFDSISEEERVIFLNDSKSNTSASQISEIHNFNSNIHKQNGFYRKLNNSQHYQIIQTKFIPKKIKKVNSQNLTEFSYYYSNTLSQHTQSDKSSIQLFQFRSKEKSVKADYMSDISNYYDPNDYISNFTQIKRPNLSPERSKSKTYIKEDQMIIEQEDEGKRQVIQNIDISFHLNEIQQKNKDFKAKMLKHATSESIKMQKSQAKCDQNFDSIDETIKIIHSSFIKNHKFNSEMKAN